MEFGNFMLILKSLVNGEEIVRTLVTIVAMFYLVMSLLKDPKGNALMMGYAAYFGFSLAFSLAMWNQPLTFLRYETYIMLSWFILTCAVVVYFVYEFLRLKNAAAKSEGKGIKSVNAIWNKDELFNINRFIRSVVIEDVPDESKKKYTLTYWNLLNLLLVFLYAALLIPYLSSFRTVSYDCRTFNWIAQQTNLTVSSDFCDGKFKVVFFGAFSTGKTTIINKLLGHDYYGATVSDDPATDKFVCINPNASRSDQIIENELLKSDCRILNAVQRQVPNQRRIEFVSDTNTKFSSFVFIDTPGYQLQYIDEPDYKSFYNYLADEADFCVFMWHTANGEIHEGLANLFRKKQLGKHYDIVWNFVPEKHDNSFISIQYAKMTQGQEKPAPHFIHKIPNDISQQTAAFNKSIESLALRLFDVKRSAKVNRNDLLKHRLESIENFNGWDALHKARAARGYLGSLQPIV